MERFLTPARLWPAGVTRLHVYLLPDLTVDAGLAGLLSRCRAVLDTVPFVAAVPDPWLHATVQMITGRAAAQISTHERQRLVAALTAALADVPACSLTVGSVMASASGVVADMDGDLPGEPFHEIYLRCRQAIADALGPDAIAYETLPPHLTLGYGIAPGDSGTVQSALRRQVRPSHATMTVRQVHLLDVVQDADRSQYRWTPVARIPLGAGPR